MACLPLLKALFRLLPLGLMARRRFMSVRTTARKRLFSLARVAHRRRCAPDEMGIYRCTHINYTTVLDRFPARYLFHNPRAAWFAAAFGQLASAGVEAMGSSQYFGYDSATGARLNWPRKLVILSRFACCPSR